MQAGDWRSIFGGGGGSTELDSTGLRCVHDFKAAHNCRKSQLCQSSSLRTNSPRIPGNLSMVSATFPFTLFNFPRVFEQLDIVQQPFVKLMYLLGLVSTNLSMAVLGYPSHRPSPLCSPSGVNGKPSILFLTLGTTNSFR